MSKSRSSDNQILGILKQAEAGTLVPELRQDNGMTTPLSRVIVNSGVRQFDQAAI